MALALLGFPSFFGSCLDGEFIDVQIGADYIAKTMRDNLIGGDSLVAHSSFVLLSAQALRVARSTPLTLTEWTAPSSRASHAMSGIWHSENADERGPVAIPLMSTSASLSYLRGLEAKRKMVTVSVQDVNEPLDGYLRLLCHILPIAPFSQ